MEGDPEFAESVTFIPHFNPLPPHGGRPRFAGFIQAHFCILIHSLRMEGDVRQPLRYIPAADFNPLPPHGGRRDRDVITGFQIAISIHSLRMEGDLLSAVFMTILSVFQSTPSAWRETLNPLQDVI